MYNFRRESQPHDVAPHSQWSSKLDAICNFPFRIFSCAENEESDEFHRIVDRSKNHENDRSQR